VLNITGKLCLLNDTFLVNRTLNMITLLGIPYDANSSFLRGPADAPGRIRQMEANGSANTFSEDGKEILNGLTYYDAGDLEIAEATGFVAHTLIRNHISELVTAKSKVISLGGDHAITFPILDAYAAVYQPLHVLHIDAHADLYDLFDQNPYSHASPFARVMERKLVTSLTQVGIRTMNSHQREQSDRFQVNVIAAKDFNLSFIRQLSGPLYISLDLDALDPAFAPGVSHHEPGGLTTREVISMIQQINVPVIGADIVEYNPHRDINNMTAMVAYKLFKELVSVML
jgi:arginase